MSPIALQSLPLNERCGVLAARSKDTCQNLQILNLTIHRIASHRIALHCMAIAKGGLPQMQVVFSYDDQEMAIVGDAIFEKPW